jgi:hypothetical protein
MKPPADGIPFLWRGVRRSATTTEAGARVALVEFLLPDGSYTAAAPPRKGDR